MPSEQSVPPHAQAGQTYEFGPFRLDVARRALYRDGEFVPLTPKAAEILVLLLEEAGRVVTKEQILERVWPGVVVEEGAIANNISALRKVLDPAFAADAGPIATVARRGYRFSAALGDRQALSAAASPAPSVAALPGTIQERDTVLLAEIENRTGDPIFDGTLRQALALHLAQTPYLEILVERRVQSMLTFMGRRGDAVVGDVALELCQRLGAKAAITGSIFALGEDYVIGLQALHGETGQVLVTEQARAHGKDKVLAALDQAAIGLRTQLGESLASVEKHSRLLDEIATTSLDALKAYTVGRQEWNSHGDAAAKPHQLRAIELDPQFASGYSALAHACNNMGQTLEAHTYLQKAYELRGRANEHERLRIECAYHTIVTGDIFKSIDAHRVWERVRPNDGIAPTNLGNAYSIAGQWDRALACAQRAMAMEQTVITSSNLSIALLAVGRHDEAQHELENAFARGADGFALHLDAYQEAFLRGDADAMRRHVAAVAGRGGEEDFLLAAQAETEACHGRFGRAREFTRQAVASARRAESLEMAASWGLLAALREAEAGQRDAVPGATEAALQISPESRHVRGMAALAFARAGDDARAREIADALCAEFPQDTILNRYWAPCTRAAIALNAADWKAATDALEPAVAVELGITMPFEGALMMAPYLRGLAMLRGGRAGEAVVEFLKITERPGLVKNWVIHPLAHRAAGEALAADGRSVEAAAMQAKFRGMWAGADAGLA